MPRNACALLAVATLQSALWLSDGFARCKLGVFSLVPFRALNLYLRKLGKRKTRSEPKIFCKT
jgi:hypothetical protein